MNGTAPERASINSRIKQIREALEMSQRRFSFMLSLSGSYIARVETKKMPVNPRLVKLIVSEFGVNEDWLKTGRGEMFSQNPDEKFTKLVGLFRELPGKYQDFVLKIVEHLLEMENA
ncbi:MAG: helix-turn-helix domain-containing protein [Spirochaetaceae bacterium]|jgi:transcriptional regulator with XRE-family HTH domain|nr:helix-turn-helix domain-containing protein [Spirochaetaceae bacterium]